MVRVQPPEVISHDGFALSESMHSVRGFALLSLRIGMKAYFSTSKSMVSRLHIFSDTANLHGLSPDCMHSIDYCSLYGQVIIHFQHFAELICKDVLRTEHDLLAIDAQSKPDLMLKLIRGEIIAPEEYNTLNSVEFNVALQRVRRLRTTGQINAKYDFIVRSNDLLDKLNHLRNRLLHRGTFVLRYPALDQLVGGHIFPFVKEVVALPEYAPHEDIWKYPRLKCGIDPMEIIAADCASGGFDMMKVALLKEFGRAAYEGPIRDSPYMELLERSDRRRAEAAARHEVREAFGTEVRECAVCGVEALVQYEDSDVVVDADAGPTELRRYPYLYRCLCCTLEVSSDLNNPSTYGLPVADFW